MRCAPLFLRKKIKLFLTQWRRTGEYPQYTDNNPESSYQAPDISKSFLKLHSGHLNGFCELLITFQFMPQKFQSNQTKQSTANQSTTGLSLETT